MIHIFGASHPAANYLIEILGSKAKIKHTHKMFIQHKTAKKKEKLIV